jgi:hypothetical protein
MIASDASPLLNCQLRCGVSDADLALQCISLREDDSPCLAEKDRKNSEPQISLFLWMFQ